MVQPSEQRAYSTMNPDIRGTGCADYLVVFAVGMGGYFLR
jgi:hypothetical protein